jgi:hypothetical protein
MSLFNCRSGSENYELNGPDERLSSSDHSDKYSHIYMYGNENGDITSKKRLLHQGSKLFDFLLCYCGVQASRFIHLRLPLQNQLRPIIR